MTARRTSGIAKQSSRPRTRAKTYSIAHLASIALRVTSLCTITLIVSANTAISASDFDSRSGRVDCGRCDDAVDLSVCTLAGDICPEVNVGEVGKEHLYGDVDGDGDGPDVDDVILLAHYLYSDHMPANVLAAADADGRDGVNIIDLCLLVEQYLSHTAASIEHDARTAEGHDPMVRVQAKR